MFCHPIEDYIIKSSTARLPIFFLRLPCSIRSSTPNEINEVENWLRNERNEKLDLIKIFALSCVCECGAETPNLVTNKNKISSFCSEAPRIKSINWIGYEIFHKNGKCPLIYRLIFDVKVEKFVIDSLEGYWLSWWLWNSQCHLIDKRNGIKTNAVVGDMSRKKVKLNEKFVCHHIKTAIEISSAYRAVREWARETGTTIVHFTLINRQYRPLHNIVFNFFGDSSVCWLSLPLSKPINQTIIVSIIHSIFIA